MGNPEIVAKDPLPDLAQLCRPMAECSPLPMILVEGTVPILRYANPAFCGLIGKKSEDLIGKAYVEMVPEAETCLALLHRIYETGQAETCTNPELVDPLRVSWSYVMWPIWGRDERPLGVMIQIIESSLFHQQAAAMNQALLLAGIRQHELTEESEKQNAQLQIEIDVRKRTEEALQKSMDEIRTLRGIVPICAHCKKIRDDKGYWNQLEIYVSKHTEAEFSHGLCPACAKELYPEYDLTPPTLPKRKPTDG